MNKRVIAALAAVFLAAVGVVMLINYASAADDRAFNGATLEKVLQINEPIAANTKAEDLAGKVKTVDLPRSAIAKGAATSLRDIAGLSTTTDLEPGEQVLLSRFAKPGGKSASKSKSAVPKGMQEVTIPLDAARAVAGTFKVGDTVGIVASYTPKEGEPFSRLILNRVQITWINGGAAATADQVGGTQMITVAVSGRNAIRIVNAVEFGKVWATKQNADTDTGNAGTIAGGAVKP